MTNSTFTRRVMLRYLAGLGLVPAVALPDGGDPEQLIPLTAENGTILVRLDSLTRLGQRLVARVQFAQDDAPVLGPEMRAAAHRQLWQLVSEGRAAGNRGDLYENRDRGHSRLSPASHPQLTHVTYDDAAREAGIDYGLAGPVLFDAPLIGNSSTAVKHGPFWRSLPRLALTQGESLLTMYQNYLSGHLHVYPGHHDHDPEHGDLIPANTPFFLASQGSSGSDRPHLEALALILAALRPETKAYLQQSSLLAPTVQMIFRRCLTAVRSRDAYYSGLAHPSVIPRDQINLMRMVSLANVLTPETVPPMVQLAVVSETQGDEGLDFFGEGLSEQFLNTPVAISRVWRSHEHSRSMVVSAEPTRDLQGRTPDFVWRILRGDPARTRIEPLDDRGLRARITIEWQSPRSVPGRRDVRSSRVDIGVFAQAGPHDSTPGLISFLLPQHETRQYASGPDGDMRIESRDLRRQNDVYADPVIFPVTDWSDQYSYDAAGTLTGWVRDHESGTSRFDAQGRLMAAEGPRNVRYVVERPTREPARVVLQPR